MSLWEAPLSGEAQTMRQTNLQPVIHVTWPRGPLPLHRRALLSPVPRPNRFPRFPHFPRANQGKSVNSRFANDLRQSLLGLPTQKLEKGSDAGPHFGDHRPWTSDLGLDATTSHASLTSLPVPQGKRRKLLSRNNLSQNRPLFPSEKTEKGSEVRNCPTANGGHSPPYLDATGLYFAIPNCCSTEIVPSPKKNIPAPKRPRRWNQPGRSSRGNRVAFQHSGIRSLEFT